MDNALRSDIHVGSGSHLSVLRHSECIEAFPVVGFGVVGYHHSVGHNDSWCAGVGGEEPEWMAGIHDECLRIGHFG